MLFRRDKDRRDYAIFVKFSTDFVDWNVEKSQQGTNLLSSSLFRRDLGRKISRWSAGVLLNIELNLVIILECRHEDVNDRVLLQERLQTC